MFEAAQKDILLGPIKIARAGRWCLVLDRREDHRRMAELASTNGASRNMNLPATGRNGVIGSSKPTSSTELTRRNAVDDRSPVEEIDTAGKLLLGDSRNVPMATRDFRVLAARRTPRWALSATGLYVSNAVRTQLLTEVRNEATIDPIITRLRTLKVDAPSKPGYRIGMSRGT